MPASTFQIVLVGLMLGIIVILCVLGLRGWYPRQNNDPPWIPPELKRKGRKHSDR